MYLSIYKELNVFKYLFVFKSIFKYENRMYLCIIYKGLNVFTDLSIIYKRLNVRNYYLYLGRAGLQL